MKTADRVAADDDARTRNRVVRALHSLGPQTARALGLQFGLTPAAVRRHLDALITADLIREVPEPKVRGRARGRGRPARLFALSEQGRAAFPHAYDELAAAALDHVRACEGVPAVAAFAHDRLADVERRYQQLLEGVEFAARPGALAAALSADGYAASAQDGSSGVQICQHHCPIAHVAAAFPQLCEAETEMIGRLLGTHVQRLATIANGDGLCTTHVPHAASTQASVPLPSGRVFA